MKKKQVQALLAGMAITLSFSLPVTTVWAAVPEKDQTVYVNADEKGNTDNIIVSNWLKNSSQDASLTDNTALKDIQNVKGPILDLMGNSRNYIRIRPKQLQRNRILPGIDRQKLLRITVLVENRLGADHFHTQKPCALLLTQ